MAAKGLMRLFLDANILFTIAHNPNGKAALVNSLGQAKLLQLVSSPIPASKPTAISRGNTPPVGRYLNSSLLRFALLQNRIRGSA